VTDCGVLQGGQSFRRAEKPEGKGETLIIFLHLSSSLFLAFLFPCRFIAFEPWVYRLRSLMAHSKLCSFPFVHCITHGALSWHVQKNQNKKYKLHLLCQSDRFVAGTSSFGISDLKRVVNSKLTGKVYVIENGEAIVGIIEGRRGVQIYWACQDIGAYWSDIFKLL